MSRDINIDITKGLGILLVILGHNICINHCVRHWIYSFHMPLFFIIGGYLYSQKGVLPSIAKDFKRLLIPYLAFVGIWVIKFSILPLLHSDITPFENYLYGMFYATAGAHNSDFIGNPIFVGVMWFLPALFWCRNIYNITNKGNLYIHCFISILIALVALYIDIYVVSLPLGIMTGASAVIFYMMGNVIRHVKLNKYVIIILLLCWILSNVYGKVGVGNCSYGIYPLDVLGALGGTIFVYFVSTHLNKVSQKFSEILQWFGRHSMEILCFHFIAQIIDVNTRLHIDNWLLFFINDIAIVCILTWISSNCNITRKLFQIQ